MTRERTLLRAAAVLGAATGVAGVIYGRKQRSKARALSDAEIDSLIAKSEVALALDENASDTGGAFAGWCVRHEAPPDPSSPWFWYLAAVGGPDPRYGMRSLRSTRGFAATEKDAYAQLEAAQQTLIEPPSQENQAP